MPTPQIFIPTSVTPKSHVNTNTISAATSTDFYLHKTQSSGAQNDEIQYDFACDAGTYDLVLFHRKGSNVGIYTVQIDGSTVGTIDGYASSGATARSSIAGIVLTTGSHTLRLAMLTKNASSSNYFFTAEAVHFQKTA